MKANLKPNFKEYLEDKVERINAVLTKILDTFEGSTLTNAIRYSVLSGGKRLRPTLVYATGEALQVPLEKLDGAAAAVELIHCYSLIHDDLPAMDNDDLRRGKPTCHKAFDEATAILAGDALQALAFEILASDKYNPHPAKQQLEMIRCLAQSAGLHGMVGGQALDMGIDRLTPDSKQSSVSPHIEPNSNVKSILHAEASFDTIARLSNIHQKKTGALIQACVKLATIAAECADSKLSTHLENYASAIGLSFQVQDDILDVIGNTETLGKATHKDLTQNKLTFPRILGLEGALQHAHTLHKSALDSLMQLNKNDHAAPTHCISNNAIPKPTSEPNQRELNQFQILEQLSEFFIQRIS